MTNCSNCNQPPPAQTKITKGLCKICINIQNKSSVYPKEQEGDPAANNELLEFNDDEPIGNILFGMYRKCYKHNIDDVINSHGRELRKLCHSYHCYIVNNLSIDDKVFNSSLTFYKGDRKSQNDIILPNKAGLSYIDKFIVQDYGWNPSDHMPISIECNLNIKNRSVAKLASWIF